MLKVGTGEVKFTGRVTLAGRLDDVLSLKVHPRANPENDRSPAYEVFITSKGRELACGSAWLKNHEKIGDFLSITVDKVGWPRAVHLTAFPPEGSSKDWSVVWSRPRAARVQDESFDELAEQET
jgi:uncharacterized protein (DUF736 family)